MKSLNRILLTLALLASAWSASAVADQTDERLDLLFEQLRSGSDEQALRQTEAEIWEIWYQSGSDEVDALMLKAAELVQGGELAAAEGIYSRVIDTKPGFSEGWNRRATVRYYQRDYEGSLADIESTLRLEPRHFGAIWGLGMILGRQQEFERAIAAFERLLEIKPNSQDARPRIELLKQEMAKNSV